MFFLPLGDDIDHRELPLGGIVLVLLNVLVFCYMLRLAHDYPQGPQVDNFIRDWGLVPADLQQGTYHGLLSHMFLHGGLWHLVGNLFFFWAFVHSLEASLGTVRFLLLYLLWGVLAGLAHAASVWGVFTPLIGASGAIGGMIGAYWVAFGPLTRIRTLFWFFGFRFYLWIPAGAFIAFWLFLQLAGVTEPKTMPGAGVAYYAHLGGFAAGAVSMFVLRRFRKAELRLDRDGTMQFAAVVREVPEAPTPEIVRPEQCPYCGTALDAQHELAPNLLRCPNPVCARCIYVEPAAV